MLIIRASFYIMQPQMALVPHIVDEEFERAGCETTVLTSAWRMYSEGSLHPYGYAQDFDSPQMPEDVNDHKWIALKVAVAERLGKEYDILAHGPRAHLHVEYDPRVKKADVVNV